MGVISCRGGGVLRERDFGGERFVLGCFCMGEGWLYGVDFVGVGF